MNFGTFRLPKEQLGWCCVGVCVSGTTHTGIQVAHCSCFCCASQRVDAHGHWLRSQISQGQRQQLSTSKHAHTAWSRQVGCPGMPTCMSHCHIEQMHIMCSPTQPKTVLFQNIFMTGKHWKQYSLTESFSYPNSGPSPHTYSKSSITCDMPFIV